MTNSILSLIQSKTKSKSNYDGDNVDVLKELIKEIEELRQEQEKITNDLDLSLRFYYEHIQPDETSLLNIISERIKVFHKFYKSQKCLSQEEIEQFKNLIIRDINTLSSMVGFYRISIELKEIFKELNESDYEAAVLKEEEKEKSKKDHETSSQNEDSDEDINANKNQKEMMRRELKEMEKKSLSTIYKRLAKAIHPDLELSDDEKGWKGELMKRVTCAYENKDLYELLALEIELMNHLNSEKQSESGEQIVIYNSILKDEVDLLRKNLNEIIHNPKYSPIQRFYKHHPSTGKYFMMLESQMLKGKINELQAFIDRLQTPEAETLFKALINQSSPPN